MRLRYLRFVIERKNLNKVQERSVSADNIVAEMPRSEENWLTVLTPMVKVNNELLGEERRRKQKEAEARMPQDKPIRSHGAWAGEIGNGF